MVLSILETINQKKVLQSIGVAPLSVSQSVVKKMARKTAIVFVILLLYCLVIDRVIGNKNHFKTDH